MRWNGTGNRQRARKKGREKRKTMNQIDKSFVKEKKEKVRSVGLPASSSGGDDSSRAQNKNVIITYSFIYDFRTYTAIYCHRVDSTEAEVVAVVRTGRPAAVAGPTLCRTQNALHIHKNNCCHYVPFAFRFYFFIYFFFVGFHFSHRFLCHRTALCRAVRCI